MDRDNIPKPDFWDSKDFRWFLREWCQFHGKSGGTRKTQQRRFGRELDLYRGKALPYLLKAFYWKCAYTEEAIDEKSAVVLFHRPLADAESETGEISPEHYWWSLCDWNNWYPASRRVEIDKGNLFPVEGPRSRSPETAEVPSEPWLEKARDQGLLLDPGRDQPAWYLEYQPNGIVEARSSVYHQPTRLPRPSSDKATLKILALNDHDLVNQRREAIESGMIEGSRILDRVGRGEFDAKAVFPWDPQGPAFSGAIRQEVAKEFLKQHLSIDFKRTSSFYSAIVIENSAKVIESLKDELAVEIWKRATFDLSWEIELSGPSQIWDPVLDTLSLLTGHSPDQLINFIETSALASRHPGSAYALDAEPRSDDSILEPADPPKAMRGGLGRKTETKDAKPTCGPVEPIIDRSARIQSVTIRNFKAIEKLELNLETSGIEILPRYGFNEPEQSAVNWTTFLGENGCGKSCCLQAIGLALAGDRLGELMTETELSWKDLLRRGEKQGRVFVRFNGGSEIDLCFNSNRHWWIGDPPRVEAFVRGYGATRLLEGDPPSTDDDAKVRLANLFDPRARVIDAERWLLDLDDEGDFNAVAVTLAKFLGAEGSPFDAPDPDTEQTPFLVRDRKAGEVLAGGDPLGYASDGFRATVALVCDIMAGLGEGFSDLRHASGIVLIDEIGAHLHPRWKMAITSRLRREFPHIQFFVSTHEPLCLRGLREREVIRVRKEPTEDPDGGHGPGRVIPEVIERSPSEYRVDQLLTSEFFGLDTTIDPDLDRRFQAYYRLLSMSPEERENTKMPWNPSRNLEEEFRDLRSEIRQLPHPVLGFTRRDQLVFEAIDEFMASEPKLSSEERKTQRQRILEKIEDIWSPPDLGDRSRGSSS